MTMFNQQTKYSQQSAFSLIELMIVLAIIGVLGALAAPNFTTLIQNNRLSSKTNDIINLISLTRQLSITRGLTVTACHTDNADITLTTCGGGTNSDWSDGFLIYAAQPRTLSDKKTLKNYDKNNDALIKQIQLADDSVTITISNGNDHLSFNKEGLLRPAGILNFTVCDDGRTKETGRRIDVSATGSTSITDITCS